MGFVKNVINGFVGNTAADASKQAAQVQAQSGADAIAFQRESRDLARSDLSPFVKFGTSNLQGLTDILTPQGQANYLQQNPLFNIAMNNLNRQSNNTFLGRGKVGDATGQLVNNAYLAGAPLLQQQTSNLFNAANIGQASAAGQANTAMGAGNSISDILTGIGNANAAGLTGAANAQNQGANNVAGLASLAALYFSDRRLKRHITRIGTHASGFPLYRFKYLWSETWSEGVMAQDVEKTRPDAVHIYRGAKCVDYGAL